MLGVPEEKLGLDKDQDEIVTGIERTYALDTAALLGGNEYLVSQMIEKLSNFSYNAEEKAALKWALTKLWAAGEEDIRSLFDNESTHQGHLMKYFSEYSQERLPRMLANGLLYCGRYEEITIIRNISTPRQKILIIDMKPHHVELPLGNSASHQPCDKIGLVYFSEPPETFLPKPPTEASGSGGSGRRRNQARKISASLALEKEMLSIINVFAIVPVP